MVDTDILTMIQYDFVEPLDGGVSMQSNLWTIPEVATALNQRTRRWLVETQAILSRTTLLTIPNTARHNLPDNWLYTDRAIWKTLSGVRSELSRGDGFEIDQADVTWPYDTQPIPLLYMDAEVPPRQIQIAPSSFDGGVIELTYVAAPTDLSNSGIVVGVPDEVVGDIKYGAETDLLQKVGRGYDSIRAAYGELRFQSCLEATKLMLSGWV